SGVGPHAPRWTSRTAWTRVETTASTARCIGPHNHPAPDGGRSETALRPGRGTCLAPVEDQIALLEVPSTIAGRVITVERAASAGLTSACTVVPVEIHDLVPRVDEVTHELLLSV